MQYGIQAASFYVPSLYLAINDLALERGIDPLKLEKGLGLHKMALADVDEDAATFAAGALLKLIQDSGVNPKEISRIYLGTESALDAAKPTATYAMEMVENVLESQYGARVFQNCDVVDLTFACIGGVDALENCLDYCRADSSRKAVVIASDYARYELGSSGEYTQGGGAVALLISSDPQLMVIHPEVGVATRSVFDFFKPRQKFSKSSLLSASETMPETLELFSDEPVFDGQYSNACYQNQIREAYEHYVSKTGTPKPYTHWRYLIFHLPYAYHGKRVFTEIYSLENNLPYEDAEQQRQVAKSEAYLKFIGEKIEPSQRASSEIGNMYTASIFMALLSALEASYDSGEELAGEELGFLAYGSGSKAKVFSGVVSKEWKKQVSKWNLKKTLEKRRQVSFETYEALHRKTQLSPVDTEALRFRLSGIESENPNTRGARYYVYGKG